MQYISGMKAPLVVLLCFLGYNLCAQASFTDPDDLGDAVNASLDGGVFIVSNGTYNDFEASFEVVATADKPIIIRAEAIGGVTLTGASHFVFKKSAYLTLEGFVFDGKGEDSLVKLEGSNNIRITRNVFELETSESIKWVFIGGVWNDNTLPFEFPSHHNRIDHNIFQNKMTPGHYITVDGSFEENGGNEIYHQSQYDLIDYNHFRNNGPRAVNEQESIRIGWSEMSNSSGYTMVEHNLFEDCDGDPEIVSVKSSDNIIRHNTFVASYGTLSLRHGNRNRVESNYFFGDGKGIGTSPAGSSLYTGGIRIYGTDHMIINNYMEGLNGTRWDAPITLTLGDAIDGESSNLSKHFRAERVTIAYNTLVNNDHGIEIGFDNNDNYQKDLEDIIIANNLITGFENSLIEIVDTDNDQGSNITWLNNLFYPTDDAEILQGASTTSFDDNAVISEDPNLELDEIEEVWKTSANTPLYENAISSEIIAADIEGQSRPLISNPGADHYSLESIRFRPLTKDDVGPNADEEMSTFTSETEKLSATKIFPIPADDFIYLSGMDINSNNVQILDLQGKVLISHRLSKSTGTLAVNTSRLRNGIYILQFLKDKRYVESKKITIEH